MKKSNSKANTISFELIDVARRCLEGGDRIAHHFHLFEEDNQIAFYDEKTKHKKSEFKIHPKDKASLVKLIGSRKWRVVVANLRSFIELYQYCTSTKRITELAISSKTEQLVELFGTQRSVSDVIDYAEKVGLLKCVDNRWHYINNDTRTAKRYIYSKDVQGLIKKVVKDEKIKFAIYKKKNQGVSHSDVLAKSVPEKVKRMIRVGADLKIDLAKYNLTEDKIRAVLDEKYPMVVRCRELANEDNKILNSREQIKCEWNIHISTSRTGKKTVTKIGFRATSGIVSFKKKANAESDPKKEKYSGVWREDYLEQELGKSWYEFDVKSSIFRVTFWLNYGVWLDNDIDLYELMYGSKFDSDEDRKAYKVYKMRPYFDSGARVASHILPAFDNSDSYKDAVKELVEGDRQWQEKVIGKSWGSEVFVWESCIYMELVHRLRSLGFKVVQVYDGFYASEKIDEKCVELILDIVKELRERFRSRFRDNKDVVENHLVEIHKRVREIQKKKKINNRIIQIIINNRTIRDNSDIPENDVELPSTNGKTVDLRAYMNIGL